MLTLLASFAGVVMLLRPVMDQNQTFAGLIGLLSGLGAAFAYMQVMAISRMGEPETRTVFYFAVGTTVAGALGMLVTDLSDWDWLHAVWLLPLVLLASLGQMCMTRAYSMSKNHGGTLMVANRQYAGIVFSAFYGLTLFGDDIPWPGWAGMALIVVSAIAATVLRARAAPHAPAEEHGMLWQRAKYRQCHAPWNMSWPERTNHELQPPCFCASIAGAGRQQTAPARF